MKRRKIINDTGTLMSRSENHHDAGMLPAIEILKIISDTRHVAYNENPKNVQKSVTMACMLHAVKTRKFKIANLG